MSENSEGDVSRRRFLAVAGSVAAASSFAAGKDSQPTKATPASKLHKVTIHATGEKLSYTTPDNPDASTLCVIKGDEIKWQIKSSGTKHHGAISFPGTNPFSDKPIPPFEWTETDEVAKKFPGGFATKLNEHKYDVAVFDVEKSKLYIDDPKIIVGTGVELLDTADELGRELEEAQKKLVLIKKALRKEKEKPH
jgi:hypothetical protein